MAASYKPVKEDANQPKTSLIQYFLSVNKDVNQSNTDSLTRMKSNTRQQLFVKEDAN